MKSGTGDDPFDDIVDEEGDGDEETEQDEKAADVKAADVKPAGGEGADVTDQTDATEPATNASRESGADGPDLASLGEGDDGIPWVLRRRSVKEDRPNVTQFFLRDETDRAERRFRGAVEERLDTDVYLLDLREAAYVVAMRHPDEVASLLGRWGYDYRD